MAEVVSNVKYRWYNVTTPSSDQEGFYLGVFADSARPLCKALGGIRVDGCEDAVAATSWSMRMERKLYAADGRRKVIVCTCDIDILLPKWVPPRAAPPGEGHATVRRFLANTETHERGHGETCTSLINSIKLLAENMPLKIPPAQADNYNGAFALFAHEFYEAIARRTDELFDKLTGHGARHGAEIARFPVDEEEDYVNMFSAELPGEGEATATATAAGGKRKSTKK
jgi:hypothetical protein